MEWLEVGKKLASVGLTTLGTVVAGPAGGAIGALLGKAISGDGHQEVTPESIMKVVGDPEAIMKMKQFELEHALELEKLALEAERLRLTDVAGARSREVETTKTVGKRDINLYVLSWVLVLGFFVLVGLLMFRQLPPDSTGVVFMLFGALSTGFGQVMQYFFGSSKSSSDKTELLAQAEPVKK
jgi:hypothetical protein